LGKPSDFWEYRIAGPEAGHKLGHDGGAAGRVALRDSHLADFFSSADSARVDKNRDASTR
jgi:hypothetical protein